ncbi:MAG TPA: A/G-specific adenine glycosylase [Polyangiaceae bacterium]|nr:A/G-specific adenine glycosylase [Polyangiaceae bacterium]
MADRIVQQLAAWYGRNRRDLAFRRTRDPYAIWVSEVMLQQTQVSSMLPYYERWMRRFPDVHALASAPEEAVLASWQGLGYYSRARRLQAAARAVVERHGGNLPSAREELTRLPGIGEYSAGAIASIAFGQRVPVVDGNVVRVLCRYYGLRGDPTRAPLKARLWQLAAELVPAREPGDFNQALMELGATLCTPRAPRCSDCPWKKSCAAQRQGLAETLPELPKRSGPTPVRAVAAVVRRKQGLLLCRLPADAPRWAGLWVLPTVELGPRETPEHGTARAVRELAGAGVEVGPRLATLTHTITRFRITLEAYEGTLGRARLAAAAAWKQPAELAELALPAPHRKLLAKLEQGT